MTLFRHFYLVLSFSLLVNNISICQVDSTQLSKNKLSLLNQDSLGLQVEATLIFLLISELGGLADYDLYSSENRLLQYWRTNKC